MQVVVVDEVYTPSICFKIVSSNSYYLVYNKISIILGNYYLGDNCIGLDKITLAGYFNYKNFYLKCFLKIYRLIIWKVR